MEKTAIGDRFKRYEATSDVMLTRRTPVIGRLDGKAFHTLTRNCTKPYDWDFATGMQHVASALMREIQGCQLAYVQSDEVSLLLVDFQRINTDAWFDYRLQKMASVAASVATYAFNSFWQKNNEVGYFDARFFTVPADDVCNYFIWRQRDAERNSLQMLAQADFSPRELHQKKTAGIHEMLHSIGVNWNDCHPQEKRGSCYFRESNGVVKFDTSIPIFSQDRAYIERHLARLD